MSLNVQWHIKEKRSSEKGKERVAKISRFYTSSGKWRRRQFTVGQRFRKVDAYLSRWSCIQDQIKRKGGEKKERKKIMLNKKWWSGLLFFVFVFGGLVWLVGFSSSAFFSSFSLSRFMLMVHSPIMQSRRRRSQNAREKVEKRGKKREGKLSRPPFITRAREC